MMIMNEFVAIMRYVYVGYDWVNGVEKWMSYIVYDYWLKKEKHVRSSENQYLVRFELVIDYYACQSNLPCECILVIA